MHAHKNFNSKFETLIICSCLAERVREYSVSYYILNYNVVTGERPQPGNGT
jgi:hypothetical protein